MNESVYNHENVRNRKNIYSSSQTNALNSIKTKNTNNDDDDDDDDINLLLNNKNLLEIIDSKCDESKQAKTNNNHLNDTFNRNLIVKKVPSSSHLQQSVAANKVIQVPTNNCNLKMPRMSSSEQMTATATTNVAKQLTNITNKNFYGSNSTTAAATSTQKTSDRKYSPAEIEQKRQQALLRLQNKQNKKCNLPPLNPNLPLFYLNCVSFFCILYVIDVKIYLKSLSLCIRFFFLVPISYN